MTVTATNAVQSKMSGNEVTLRGTVKAGINGAIFSATGVLTEEKKYSKKAVIGFRAVSGFRDTYKSSREDGKTKMKAFNYGLATAVQQGVLGIMDSYLGDVLPEKSDWMNITARGIQRGVSDVFWVTSGIAVDLIWGR